MKVSTCDPQFGNGIAFLRMLDEDHAAVEKFLGQVAYQDLGQKT